MLVVILHPPRYSRPYVILVYQLRIFGLQAAQGENRWWLTVITLVAIQLGWGLWLCPYDYARMGWGGATAAILVLAGSPVLASKCSVSSKQQDVGACGQVNLCAWAALLPSSLMPAGSQRLPSSTHYILEENATSTWALAAPPLFSCWYCYAVVLVGHIARVSHSVMHC